MNPNDEHGAGLKFLIGLLSIALFAAISFAQENAALVRPPLEASSPALLWHRQYGGAQDDAAFSIREVKNGDLAAGGDCIVDSTGLRKMCLTLLGPYGDERWQKHFEGDQTASCRSVRLTNEGGFVLCGSTRGVGSRGIDHYIVKTDANGLEEWSRISQERGADYAEDILHARGGGFISAGRKVSNDSDSTTGGFHIVKTNKPGKVVWTRNYDGEQANAIIEIEDGNLVAAGYTKHIPASARPPKPEREDRMPWEEEMAPEDTSLCFEEAGYYLVKVNWKGELIWTRTYWNSGWDVAYDVAQTRDEGFLLAGTAGGCKDKPEHNDIWILRTNAKGDTLWSYRFPGVREDVPQAIIESKDGGAVVAGYTYSFGAGQADMLIFKLDEKGTLLWSKTIGGTQDEFARDVQQTLDGGYIISGSTDSFGSGGSDMYICKLRGE